jgi:hypothetical protein
MCEQGPEKCDRLHPHHSTSRAVFPSVLKRQQTSARLFVVIGMQLALGDPSIHVTAVLLQSTFVFSPPSRRLWDKSAHRQGVMSWGAGCHVWPARVWWG